MIVEYILYNDSTQRIDTNTNGIIGCRLTEWEKEKNENQVIEIEFIDERQKTVSQIFISKHDFIKAALKIMIV
jgi:hypothetical protein